DDGDRRRCRDRLHRPVRRADQGRPLMRAPANSNTSPEPTREETRAEIVATFAPSPEAVAVAVAMARRAAEARREYEEHGRAADDFKARTDAFVRDFPDFAPVYAEPGEMERREKAETDEAGFRTIAVAIAIGCLAASPILAILIATYMRGGL
ncbi:hypothetical protein NS365_12480, partial [Aureimonas ureilytica]